MFRGPVARAGASTLPLFHSCPSPSCICVSPPLSIARNDTLVHAANSTCAQLTVGLALGCLGSESSRWSYNYFPPSSSGLRPDGKRISRCTRASTPWHKHEPREIFFSGTQGSISLNNVKSSHNFLTSNAWEDTRLI